MSSFMIFDNMNKDARCSVSNPSSSTTTLLRHNTTYDRNRLLYCFSFLNMSNIL